MSDGSRKMETVTTGVYAQKGSKRKEGPAGEEGELGFFCFLMMMG